MGRVDGKVSIVTGGGGGIGRATSRLLAREGSTVVVTDVASDEGQRTVELIEEEDGEAIFEEQDVTQESSWDRIVDSTCGRFGTVDVLVNNAGMVLVERLVDTQLDDWRDLMRVNVDGVFLGMKHCIPAMQDAGGGSVINISSIAALIGTPKYSAYGASKGAVWSITKDAAIEYASDNVRVNSVHPGYIDTPMVDRILEDSKLRKESLEKKAHPIGRMGKPRDIANGILYLASNESSFVTGTQLVIDGGLTAR